MKKITKLFLITNGIILMVYSLIFLIKPTALGELVGFTANSPNTLVEVMAFYGGLEMGLGCFFIWSALNIKRYKIALSAFTFIFFAAGMARLTGILQYGCEDPSQLIVTGIELLFSFFAFYINAIVPFIQKKEEQYKLLCLLNEVTHHLKSDARKHFS